MLVAKSLEIWTVQTLCDIGILLSVFSSLLHIGRPYFERILGRIIAMDAGCVSESVRSLRWNCLANQALPSAKRRKLYRTRE